MSDQILLHVKDANDEAEVRKYLQLPADRTKVVYRTKSTSEADANGVIRVLTSTNPDADLAVRDAARTGTPVYTTGVFLDNAEGIGDVMFINQWALKNKSKTKSGVQHCFLANVKDTEALAKLKEMVEFQKAFGLGGDDSETPF
jgi:hypothetical protein